MPKFYADFESFVRFQNSDLCCATNFFI